MTNTEFKQLLKEVFATHMFMDSRDYHSVNELLYVLRYDERFKSLQGVNISVAKLDEGWTCISCLDAFVDLHTLGIWFSDDTVEFEFDEFELDGEKMRFDNITVYERKVK